MATTALTLPEVLLRHVIGLEQFSRFAETAQTSPNYPPHNVEQLAETDGNVDGDRYRLTLAVAGFTRDEIEVTLHRGILKVSGAKKATDVDTETPRKFLYRGISFRDFERQFNLAEHIQVSAVSLEDGLLEIDLERIIPEEAKPRKLTIS